MNTTSRQAVVLLSFFLVGLCGNVAVAVQWTKVPAIFAFGDSLIDAGNNNFVEGSTTLANFLPYGETFFHKPTGRFTNGRLVFDFLASKLGLPFMPPFLRPGAAFKKGVNFGSAGSGILSTTGGHGVIPFTTQVNEFQQVATKLANDLGAAAAGDLISNSLFFFVTGSNDLSAFLGNSTLQKSITPTEFVTNVLSQLQAHAQTVYSLGARKVVFLGIAPLGCSPEAMAASNATNGDCVAGPNQLAQAYNAALLQLVEGLNSKLPDLHAVLANPFDTIKGLIMNGTAHGFTQGSAACCGRGPFNGAVRCGPNGSTNLCDNVDNFVFWDLLHPTQRVNHIIAKLLWSGDDSFIQPMNLKTLAQL